jgi:hypothetical protein
MSNHPLPPEFEYDSDFPLQWCDVKHKLHCDKSNVDKFKFSRYCPLCIGGPVLVLYKTYDIWQKHVADYHDCKVTLTYTEEQKKENRETQLKRNAAAKKLKNIKKKRREPANRK